MSVRTDRLSWLVLVGAAIIGLGWLAMCLIAILVLGWR